MVKCSFPRHWLANYLLEIYQIRAANLPWADFLELSWPFTGWQGKPKSCHVQLSKTEPAQASLYPSIHWLTKAPQPINLYQRLVEAEACWSGRKGSWAKPGRKGHGVNPREIDRRKNRQSRQFDNERKDEEGTATVSHSPAATIRPWGEIYIL